MATSRDRDVLRASPDESRAPVVGAYAKDKYRLVYNYANQFATAMKKKWDARVYIDLFAGPGKTRVRGTGELLRSSPLLALAVDHPFDRYVFCEADLDLIGTLKDRVARDHPDRSVTFVHGDCNEKAEEIVEFVRPTRSTDKTLAFCFADPYKIGDLRFRTIETLSRVFVDFLILVPTHMDFNRNVATYLGARSNTVAGFLGDRDWRERFTVLTRQGDDVDVALTKLFSERMRGLGYEHHRVEETKLIRLPGLNVPLYRLAFYSRHPLGERFWKDAQKASDPQRSFEF